MATSRESLIADAGVRFTTVVLIEGYQYALTDGDPTAVLNALDSGAAPFTSYADVIGGMSAKWDLSQRAHPWKALDTEPPSFGFSVVPGVLYSTGATVDTFGSDAFKRTGGTETSLADTGSLTPVSTTVVTRRADAFAATGTVYIGPEAIGYGARDAGTDTFSTLTRAKWTPFTTSDGTHFARSHTAFDLAAATGDPIGVKASPIVSTLPTKWIGRWVAVYILVDRGGALDAFDGANHRAFAGTISSISQDSSGATVVECSSVVRRIYETQILRDQFRASLQEGVELRAGTYFQARNVRIVGATTTIGDATVLLVKVGASGANEIEPGTYTAVEIGEKVTAWLRAEKLAARLLFHTAYDGAFASGLAGGIRGNLSYEDPTVTADSRRCVLTLPSFEVSKFLGWGGQQPVIASDQGRSGFVNSPNVPLRIELLDIATGGSRALANPSGTWIDQTDTLPAALQIPAGTVDGVLKIGDFGYAVVVRASDVLFTFPVLSTAAYLPSVYAGIGAASIGIPIGDDRSLDVTQVVVMEGTFRELLLKVLLSTGSLNYNSEWDDFGESIGCGIPHSILGTSFVTDLDNLAESGRSLCMIVDKPTRFVDLFQADFLARWAFFVYTAGRLQIRSWSTPTATSLGAIAVGEADRAAIADGSPGPSARSSCVESFASMQNVIKVSFERASDGDLISNLTLFDRDSIAAHGPRGFKIELRNSAGRTAVGNTIGLLGAFSAALPHFTKPSQIITRSMSRQMFEQLAPGQHVVLTDPQVRSPDTGLRGLVGWPGIVTASRCNWGSGVPGLDGTPTKSDTSGEVEIMIFDRVNGAPYSPCAEVDDTADAGGFTSGYSSGTLTLRCYANKHSTTGADAAQFVAGDRVRIIEIDPAVAASADSWDRIVASQSGNDIVLTVALSAPAWDAAKFYRVVSDTYLDAVSTQITDVYQAASGDGLVADARAPYGLVYSGTGQSSTFTASASTEVPARHSTLAYGDGVALDVGYERDIARLANNLIDYKTAPQTSQVAREEWVYGGAGTWEVVSCSPVLVGVGLLGANETIKLYVAPFWKSTDGTSTQVRYTLSRLWPSDADRDDVTFPEPYVQATFTTTSLTYAMGTPTALDTRHINRAPGSLGGVGWLTVEIKTKASVRGDAGSLRVGPRVAP